MCSLENAGCISYGCVNPIHLDGVISELLFSQFIRVIFNIKWLRVKEIGGLHRDSELHLATVRSFPKGVNARGIK